MIPRNIIEDLKARSDIEDVISSYVTLKRAGSNMVGLCPFHSEKTPSFSVNTTQGYFHCFGCGAGGDVITFIMRIENLEYMAAIEFLARRAGYTLPDDMNAADDGVPRSRIVEMNKCAARFYRDMLYDEGQGVRAREYIQKRQLSPSIVRRFGLGYAPESFGALRDHLAKNGYTTEEAVAGFLCGISKKNGTPYDYFRGRLMFPIIDVSGNIVAFGGRVLDDSLPKYLNSSDTPAFKKRRNLFALNYAKSFCAESMILCEGYMDVIMLHEAGFQNAVATLGTAIAEDHARLMQKYTKKVIISYDSDEAGQRAADKALRELGKVGLEASVLTVTGAKDPDEFIKKFGRDKFAELLGQSRGRFDFNAARITSKYPKKADGTFVSGDDLIKAADELCEFIAAIYSPTEREICIGRAAEMLGLSKASMTDNVTRYLRRKKKKDASALQSEAFRQTARTGDRVNTQAISAPGAAQIEESLLGMMQIRQEYFGAIQKGALSESDFVTDFNRRVFAAIVRQLDESGGFDVGCLADEFTPDEVARITAMRVRRENLDNGDAVFAENAAALRRENQRKNAGDIGDILSMRRGETKNSQNK